MRFVLASLLWLYSSLVLAQLPTGTPGANPFAQPDFLPVEEAYQLAVEPADDGRIRLYWRIAEGYYLYQHAFDFRLEHGGEPLEVGAEVPPGLARSDEFFGDVQVYYNEVEVQLQAREPPGFARLSVQSQGCADAGLCYPPRTEVFDIDFGTGQVNPVALAPATAAVSLPAAGARLSALPYMLLLAFFGGAILNLMPCVFPVLSLKVLGFANTGRQERLHHGWLYTLGVIASFLAVASVLIALQTAGQAVGWGFQLQSPGFVIALAYLFLAMGLSLSGMVQLGSSVMNLGGSLAGRQGSAGSFFTGVLAVVVASPCTAPFMGTALGFALTQPALVSLAIFFALGAGMAAPMLLLSYSSRARDWLPRPGAWMETLKQLLAFPLYATAIWLVWVAGRQTSVDTMAAALSGGLLLALALWLWQGNTSSGRASSGRTARRVLALASLAGAVALGLWRIPAAPDTGVDDASVWSEERVEELRRSGRPVFVDVTADWCITCIANERGVLYTEAVQSAFREHNVAFLVADWTNYDADIANYLRSHGRSGIPLYVLYPADPAAAPVLLPQVLTRNGVISSLERISTDKG
jgi:thiol:disulfide interchange protein DsbD